jgi:hypothetical protein
MPREVSAETWSSMSEMSGEMTMQGLLTTSGGI